MLSHLYRIVRQFERRHGIAPNLLYLNREHYQRLREALPGLRNDAELLERLRMDLVLEPDIPHPKVVWRALPARAV